MKNIRRKGIEAVLGIALFYLIMALLGAGCPIAFFTGISCAGCGMTRAWLSFLKGDMQLALYYHPLFWMVIPLAVWIPAGRVMKRKLYQTGLAVVAIAFVLLYIWRMLWGDGTVVYFRPAQGAIVSTYRKIIIFIGGYL